MCFKAPAGTSFAVTGLIDRKCHSAWPALTGLAGATHLKAPDQNIYSHDHVPSVFRVPYCRSPTATAAYSKFLLEEVLAPSDADPSAGFSLHIADIIVQELISVCEDSPVPPPALQVRLGCM